MDSLADVEVSKFNEFIDGLGDDEPDTQSKDNEKDESTVSNKDGDSLKSGEDTPKGEEPEPDSADYWKGRYKGQQAAWTKEHESSISQATEIEQLKARLDGTPKPDSVSDQEGDAPADDLDGWDERADEDIHAATKEMFKIQQKAIADVKDRNAILEETIRTHRIVAQEDIMRSNHDDFDEMINDVLLPAFKSNPAYLDEWIKKGETAEAAYTLANKIKQSSEILDDPEAYEKKLREKIAEELQSGGGNGNGNGQSMTVEPKKTISKGLSSVNSQTSAPPGNVSAPSSDPLDGFFAETKKEQESRYA